MSGRLGVELVYDRQNMFSYPAPHHAIGMTTFST
jgi:hypothetical protein